MRCSTSPPQGASAGGAGRGALRSRRRSPAAAAHVFQHPFPNIGWHYLSNATCPIRPRLFHALFVVPRTIIICQFLGRF